MPEKKVTRIDARDWIVPAMHHFLRSEDTPADVRNSVAHVIDYISGLPFDTKLPMKTCSRCLSVYPASEEYFDYLEKSADNLKYECKKCSRKYNRKYKRQVRKRSKYPPGDLEEIQRLQKENELGVEWFPEKRKSKTSLRDAGLERIGQGGGASKEVPF